MSKLYKTREGGSTVTIFVPYDCCNNCPFCINKAEYANNEGFSADKICESIKYIDSVTPNCDIVFTGGEPFGQPAACAELARRAHEKGLNVWTFSGYLYEKLLEMAAEDESVADLLNRTDVLVEGPFLLAERSLELLYKGSKNQRIIDMNKTRAEGGIVLYTQPEW